MSSHTRFPAATAPIAPQPPLPPLPPLPPSGTTTTSPTRRPSLHQDIQRASDRWRDQFSDYKTTRQFSQPTVRRPTYAPSPVGTARRTASTAQITYCCSLCRSTIMQPTPPSLAPSTGKVTCSDCIKRVYDLAVCWACGEMVYRKSDAVSFGVCWWHWGCLCCLSCRVC